MNENRPLRGDRQRVGPLYRRHGRDDRQRGGGRSARKISAPWDGANAPLSGWPMPGSGGPLSWRPFASWWPTAWPRRRWTARQLGAPSGRRRTEPRDATSPAQRWLGLSAGERGPMPDDIIGMVDMEAIFSVTDTLGIHRESVSVELTKEDPGSVAQGPDGAIMITAPKSKSIQDFSATWKPSSRRWVIPARSRERKRGLALGRVSGSVTRTSGPRLVHGVASRRHGSLPVEGVRLTCQRRERTLQARRSEGRLSLSRVGPCRCG